MTLAAEPPGLFRAPPQSGAFVQPLAVFVVLRRAGRGSTVDPTLHSEHVRGEQLGKKNREPLVTNIGRDSGQDLEDFALLKSRPPRVSLHLSLSLALIVKQHVHRPECWGANEKNLCEKWMRTEALRRRSGRRGRTPGPSLSPAGFRGWVRRPSGPARGSTGMARCSRRKSARWVRACVAKRRPPGPDCCVRVWGP